MKVAILKRTFHPFGGSERYCLKTLEELSRMGIEVDVYTCITSAWPTVNNVTLRKAGPSKGPNFLQLLIFNYVNRKILSQRDYKFVLSMDRTIYHTHIRAGGGCHRAWLERKARYLQERTPISVYDELLLYLERKAFTSPWVVKIIVNSELVKHEIVSYYDINESMISVVRNGVEWEYLGAAFEEGLSVKYQLRRRLGLDTSKFHFLFVGSGYRRKGLSYALRALARFREEVALIVVGKDRHIDRYRSLAEKLGVSTRVYFFGAQETVLPFYQVADAFLLPTLYDPCSNATLEALAMGLYVVTTKDNGAHEVIQDFAGTVVNNPSELDELHWAMSKAVEAKKDPYRIRESVSHLSLKQKVKELLKICLHG